MISSSFSFPAAARHTQTSIRYRESQPRRPSRQCEGIYDGCRAWCLSFPRTTGVPHCVAKGKVESSRLYACVTRVSTTSSHRYRRDRIPSPRSGGALLLHQRLCAHRYFGRAVDPHTLANNCAAPFIAAIVAVLQRSPSENLNEGYTSFANATPIMLSRVTSRASSASLQFSVPVGRLGTTR